MNIKSLSREQAETIALQAVTFILSSEILLGRFLETTGTDGDMLKSLSSETLRAALEFLLNFEPDLLEFCVENKLPPEVPLRAHALLSGPVRDTFGW